MFNFLNLLFFLVIYDDFNGYFIIYFKEDVNDVNDDNLSFI